MYVTYGIIWNKTCLKVGHKQAFIKVIISYVFSTTNTYLVICYDNISNTLHCVICDGKEFF